MFEELFLISLAGEDSSTTILTNVNAASLLSGVDNSKEHGKSSKIRGSDKSFKNCIENKKE